MKAVLPKASRLTWLISIACRHATQGLVSVFLIAGLSGPLRAVVSDSDRPLSAASKRALKYRGGIAALLTTDGPEKNTIQYAPDGIKFEIEAAIKNAPQALGLFRTADQNKGPLEGIRWGLCHTWSGGAQGRWAYIQRFHIDETLKNWFLNKATYE